MKCKHCKTEIIQKDNYRRIYCSQECKKKHKDKIRYYRGRTPKICEQCGAEYMPKRPGTVCCSRECGFKYQAIKAEKNRKPIVSMISICCCTVCRRTFYTRKGMERNICGKECSIKNIITTQCIDCGNVFSQRTHMGRPEKRCTACTKERNRFIRRETMKRIGKNHRAKAKHYGGNIERFNIFDVFKRDNWICQICGIVTPSSIRGTLEDNAPELDHIIPLSKGGGHTYMNTQTCCRKCNQLKGNKINYIPPSPVAKSRECNARPHAPTFIS